MACPCLTTIVAEAGNDSHGHIDVVRNLVSTCPPVALDRVPVAYLQPKPLISYSATTLTASANQDAKTLSGTSSKLGIPLVADPMVNDSLLTYDSNWHAAGDRELGDYNDDVHHSETAVLNNHLGCTRRVGRIAAPIHPHGVSSHPIA